jgi:hypothetical protein
VVQLAGEAEGGGLRPPTAIRPLHLATSVDDPILREVGKERGVST